MVSLWRLWFCVYMYGAGIPYNFALVFFELGPAMDLYLFPDLSCCWYDVMSCDRSRANAVQTWRGEGAGYICCIIIVCVELYRRVDAYPSPPFLTCKNLQTDIRERRERERESYLFMRLFPRPYRKRKDFPADARVLYQSCDVGFFLLSKSNFKMCAG